MVTPVRARQTVRFGDYEADPNSGELRRLGHKLKLPDQSFRILYLLLERPGEVVTRDELRRELWTEDTFVDFEAGLNSAVKRLRDALNDSADKPRFVETLPRHGYRFIADVQVTQALIHPAPVPFRESNRHHPSFQRKREHGALGGGRGEQVWPWRESCPLLSC